MADSVEPGLTIRCQQVVELVTDYLEGALDSTTRTELEAHLERCPACAEYVRQMQATLRMVGHVPLESLSTQAKADLIAAFRELPPRRLCLGLSVRLGPRGRTRANARLHHHRPRRPTAGRSREPGTP